MKGSRPIRRPYARTRRGLLGLSGPDSASGLASRAGRASVERLEARQLLFSMTITPDNVGPDGLGTATAWFGYTIPYMFTTAEPGDADPQTVIEQFDEDDIGLVGNGTEFPDSSLRIRHNVTPAVDVQVIVDTVGGEPVQGSERLRVRLADPGEQISLEFDSGDDVAVDNPDRAMLEMRMLIDRTTGVFGLPYQDVEAIVLFRGQELARFTGNALRDLNQAPTGPSGLEEGRGEFVFSADDPRIGDPFDRVIFRALRGPTAPFTIDNIQGTFPASNNSGVVESRIYGVEMRLTGPVGATVQVLDLDGEDIVRTIRLGRPGNADFLLVDPDDDGVANFNVGIGRIILSDVDQRTQLSMMGGTIEAGENTQNDPDIFQEGTGDNAFIYTPADELLGLFSQWETAGFGYAWDFINARASGLPAGVGSVIIGSPYVRGANDNPYGFASALDPSLPFLPIMGDQQSEWDNFAFSDQGIFVLDGSSMGRVNIHGVVHGSSHFTGAINEFTVGLLMGSVTIEGDAGVIVSASDAGVWAPDPDFGGPYPIEVAYKTYSEIFVGRSVQEIAAGGRLLSDITVLGDINSPTARPPLDNLRYLERERVQPFDEGAQITPRTVLRRALSPFYLSDELNSPYMFGSQFYRNDTIMAAEWVGSLGTAVEISGSVGFGDPVVNTAEDPADVFAFASDGRTPIVLQTDLGAVYIRIMDHDGRTLAAVDQFDETQDAAMLRFDPPNPGVYYLVVSATVDGDFNDTGTFYTIALSGMAPTTLGSIRSGASIGSFNSAVVPNSVHLMAGNAGVVRAGTAYFIGGGETESPAMITNRAEDVEDDELLHMTGVTVSIPGNLYSITAGSDIVPPGLGNTASFQIGGHLGSLVVGVSDLLSEGERDGTEGDIHFLTLRVGGSIALMDIKGGIGIDQDGDDDALSLVAGAAFQVVTGTEGLGGDIGLIRVGSHVQSGTLLIDIPDGATVGGLLISQDVAIDDGDPDIGFIGGGSLDLVENTIRSGGASDVRFVDFPEIDLQNSVNAGIELFVGQAVELTDDAGGTVRITITGLPSAAPVGFVRFLPINGSRGVAIAQIEANLSGGRQLQIQSSGQPNERDPVSIGTINIVDANNISSLDIGGTVPVDVWRVVQTGGAAFDRIINRTPGGDIVNADVVGVNTVEIQSGSLGRTEMPAWGPRMLGLRLGVGQGLNEEVGGALGVNGAVIFAGWGGELYRPTNNVDTGTVFLDDVGGPFGDELNGLVVRSGSVQRVSVGGTVGDVILQGGVGTSIVLLEADADRVNDPFRFDGIAGSIYAELIQTLEIGEGIAASAPSPIATAGVFADEGIQTIRSQNTPGADISGIIVAANNTITAPPAPDLGGIDLIQLNSGGHFIDAFIAVARLDDFWTSPLIGEGQTITGDIQRLEGTGANFFRSQITALNIVNFTLNGGFYDASLFNALNNATQITAAGYRNSTSTGTMLEFAPSVILIGGDLNRLQTTPGGTFADTRLDVVGSVTGSIAAHHFIRAVVDVDNRLTAMNAAGSIRGSSVTVGRANTIAAVGSIAASTFEIAGPLQQMTAGGSIVNTDIRVAGQDGRLGLLQAADLISGTLYVAGPITTVQSTGGDIRLNVTTVGQRGSVGTISAGRDLVLDADISQGVGALVAGRHIGDRKDPTIILVHSDLTSISAPNGALYSDIRISGRLGVAGGGGGGATPGVVLGRVPNLAGNNQVSTGSLFAADRIGSVTINGDFGGSITSGANGIASIVINDGSFLPRGSIRALAGDLESLVINRGHLLGDVHADFDIVSLRVVASGDGTFGDVGVNPNLSATRRADDFRNQLPLGVAPTRGIDGPRITAGHNIRSVVVGGSVFETLFWAGRDVFRVEVAENVRRSGNTPGPNSFVLAGDNVRNVIVGNNARDLLVAAGVWHLGADNLPGGTGANADAVHEGDVRNVEIGNAAQRVRIAAGMHAGPDGVYASSDDLTAIGRSRVQSVSIDGPASNVRVSADTASASVRNNNKLNVMNLRANISDPLIVNGPQQGQEISSGGLSFEHAGQSGTIFFSGPGTATWQPAQGRVVINNTNLNSTLRVVSDTGRLRNFNIVSKDNARLGTLEVDGRLVGNSNIVVDRDVRTVSLGDVETTGVLRFGSGIGTITTGNFRSGRLEAESVDAVQINGDFGDANPSVRGEAQMRFFEAGTISVSGVLQGDIRVVRDLDRVAAGGKIDNALISVGGALGAPGGGGGGGAANAAVAAPSVRQTRIAAGESMGNVNIGGEFFDSAILVGVDLGENADFGGSGINADAVRAGDLGNVLIGGHFFESDIVAGALRGPDGFYGTGDDRLAPGVSSIGNVTISGSGVGSTRFTESYRILSTGEIGNVSIGGQAGRDIGNFRIVEREPLPAPIQIVDLRVRQASLIYTAEIAFNQPIDASTIGQALSVREVRGQVGSREIFLIEGRDYQLNYVDSENLLRIRFDRAITGRDLPQAPGVPGPGIFRFVLDSDLLRGQVQGSRLDGDGDGFAEPGDHFSADDIVGDAGDKLVRNRAEAIIGGNVAGIVDFYDPINLDIVMDNNHNSNGLPDTNKPFTLRGTIGDHPDHNVNFFSFASDMDLYRITLQAGQILRLGPVEGPAQFAPVNLFLANGAGVTTQQVLPLPSALLTRVDAVPERVFHIRQTGTYIIGVGRATDTIGQPNVVPHLVTEGGTVGDYRFTIEVFDDGNSGFSAETEAGNGQVLPRVPDSSLFAGPDGELGTDDDVQRVVIGAYAFTIAAGPDGEFGTDDDVIRGDNDDDVAIVHRNGRTTTTVSSAIGPRGHSGVPNDVYADVDVYHINGREGVAPGTRIAVTIRLAEFGGDLGSRVSDVFGFEDFADAVEFAIFDTTNSTGLDDATLLLSPSDFSPNGGEPGVLASNRDNRYGFNDAGDFFIEFVAPGRIGAPTPQPATYAVYLQGAFNTDYELEIVVGGQGVAPTRGQNFFIETNGGTIDWLLAGGLELELSGFDPAVLGIVGESRTGIPVGQFVLGSVIDNLNSIFQGAGFDVTFSDNPADFEFQDFSTIYLSSSVDPISPIFDVFDFFGLFTFGLNLSTQPLHFAQHADALNMDTQDEGVVFVPSFSQLGLTPSAHDVDELIGSLTAAIGQNAGELLGLRKTAPNGVASPIRDIMAADAMVNRPDSGEGYSLPTLDRTLSTPLDQAEDTNFWLGRQSAGSLLQKILSQI